MKISVFMNLKLAEFKKLCPKPPKIAKIVKNKIEGTPILKLAMIKRLREY